MSEGPNENCEIYENYENYENCENSQDLRGTQRDLRKGTKNGLLIYVGSIRVYAITCI